MIGVDIIDHSFSFRNSKYTLEQYKNRILNKSEFLFCTNWNELDILWAIKESAYKNHFKKTGFYFINPKRIMIVSLDLVERKFTVEIDEHYYSGTFEDKPEYVYAICGGAGPVKLFLHKTNGLIDVPSELPPFSINHHIEYHPEGFPEFIVQEGSKYAYSRSHHGNYYISAMSAFSHN